MSDRARNQTAATRLGHLVVDATSSIAVWRLSLVLATLSDAAPASSQGGPWRMDSALTAEAVDETGEPSQAPAHLGQTRRQMRDRVGLLFRFAVLCRA
jgi:hypothetical protein